MTCCYYNKALTDISWVNFNIILPAAFTLVDPKSAKRDLWHDCLFALLGSAFVKAVHKNVGEIDPRKQSYKNTFVWKMTKFASDSLTVHYLIRDHYNIVN